MTDTIDPMIDELPPRYVIGIDLGTTNSAVTYVDTDESPWSIRVFLIPQQVSPTETESLDTLPSFYFQPAAGSASFDFCVGAYARDESAKVSGRGIASAKSWLCHSGVDRTAPLLPWHGADDVRRLSPVEASSSYLKHIRQAWDQKFPAHAMAEQDIVLTLPASFDEVARELTIEAAKMAGLPRIILIEEPQAAFYAWIYKHDTDWEQRVEVGQTILVCDIGGGTSDFTLIRVRESDVPRNSVRDETEAPAKAINQDSDKAQATLYEKYHNTEKESRATKFHRVAVGTHLILGGDNLDLAIAKYVEGKLTKGKRLEPFQWDVLVGTSRRIKEAFLSEGNLDSMSVNLPSRGSKLIGGGLQTEVTRDEIQKLVLEGFLPVVELHERPRELQSGFQELGLPYASDPAITRYLAQFLVTHAHDATDTENPQPATYNSQPNIRPDVVLFNGGFFESPLLRQRLIDQIATWFKTEKEPDWQPLVLENDRLDLAVARGAAYYGMVRRDQGVRIVATLARSYYIGIGGNPPQAICIMPGSAEPGETYTLADRSFKLTVSQPVEFSIFVSSVRLADLPGLIVPIDSEQMTSLPPIRTVLRTKSKSEKRDLSVHLKIGLTELGTIDLSCHEIGSDRSWKLQFDVRSATQTDVAEYSGTGESEGILDEATWDACEQAITQTFGTSHRNESADPKELVKLLSETTGLNRDEWPMTLLRRIWGTLIDCESGRRQSPQHESRWLNLLGFSLRPGYGIALDDWRVGETWRHVHGKLSQNSPNIRNESLILWRRVAGGLTRGQQQMIAEPWLAAIRALAKQLSGRPTKGGAVPLRPEESVEVWRLLGSLELLSLDQKKELGDLALAMLSKPKMSKARDAMIWAMGRLGNRSPLYGPLNTVLSASQIENWIETLIRTDFSSGVVYLALAQLSRRTEDRYRDLDEGTRDAVVRWLTKQSAPEHLVELVRVGGKLDTDEQNRVFGETLPPGLRLE